MDRPASDTPAAAPTAEREAFETYATPRCLPLPKRPDSEYASVTTQEAWDAWQARAALSAPVAAQPAASGVTKVADAARVLAEFAKTAPGRLPSRVQEAIEVALSTALTGAAKDVK